MISDEGGYAHVAQRWLDGRGRLYHDIWISRPQGIFVVYGLIFNTLGTTVVALRLGAWLFSLATLVFVWLFARDWAGRRTATGAAFLFAVVSSSPNIEGFTANAEVFMALPAAAGAWLLLRASRRGWPAGPLLGVGILAGLATLLKPSGIVMVPVSLGFVWLGGSDGNRAAARRGAWIASGFALASVPALVHGWLVGWHAFVFAVVTYRLRYQSSATVPPVHHVLALYELILRSSPFLVAVGVALAARRWQRRNRRGARRWTDRLFEASRTGIVAGPVRSLPTVRRGADGDLLLRLWLLGCLAGIAMGGDWWFHYLIQIAAPFAVWLAWLLLDVMSRLPSRPRWGLALTVVVILLAPMKVLALGDPGRISYDLYGHPGYPMQDEVAAYVREHTQPETPILVAFNQAALYYLADRPAAYRYLYDQELSAIPGAEAQLVALVDSPRRPLYVIGTRQQAPFPDRGQVFWEAVGRHYHLETIVRGVPIYRADAPLPTGPHVPP